MSERKVPLCSHCVEKILKQRLGATVSVSVQSGSQFFVGKLKGVHVNGRFLKVLLETEAGFRVVENVACINFPNQKGEGKK